MIVLILKSWTSVKFFGKCLTIDVTFGVATERLQLNEFLLRPLTVSLPTEPEWCCLCQCLG